MKGFWHGSLIAGWRRRGWFLENLTPRKFANLCLASLEFALKRETMRALPVVVKIDISPVCNLKCTVCVHADPRGEDYLEKQSFHATQKMSVEFYRRIIEQIEGRSTAVSLYYFGDPLAHPDLDEMCRIARDAKLNVHVSTNFSFKLSDERLRRLVQNGMTHFTVCVDGLSQEKYEQTRVGGHIDWVLSNLERICRYKQESGERYPKIEVQYISFEHNRHEVETAQHLFEDLKVDQVTVFEGRHESWARPVADTKDIRSPKENRLLPQCVWPHLFMLIKYNGDIIPCCHHRIGEQYSTRNESRAVGNVNERSLREIWNSPAYRQMRRLVNNPTRGAAEAGAGAGFCHGCDIVYNLREGESPAAAAAIPRAVEVSVSP
jgi:MoaA/NifB/PqqE/SkfB family radical SAM enzyme